MTHQTTTTIPIQSPSHQHVNQQQHQPGSSQQSLTPNNNHTPMTLAAKNNYSATSTTTAPNKHGVNQQQLQNKNHHYVKSSDQLQQYLDLLERQKDRHEQKLKTIVNVIDNIKHSLTMLEALEAETMSILNDDDEENGDDVVMDTTNPNIDHVSYTSNGRGTIDVAHDDRVKNMLLPKTANLVHRLMQKRIYSDIIQHMSETQSSGTTAPLSSSSASGRPIASSSLSSYNNNNGRLSKRKLNESEHMYDPVQEEQAKRRRRAMEKSPATANREFDLNGGGDDEDYEYSYERQANFGMNHDDDHHNVYNQDYYYDDDEENINFEGYREEAHNDYNDHYMEDQVASIIYNRNVNRDMSSRHQQNTAGGASSSRRNNLYNGVASGSATSTADQQRRRRKRRDGSTNSTSRGRYDDETSSLLLSLHDSPKNSRDKQSQLHKRYSNGGDVNSDEEDTHDELEIDTRDEHDNNDGESEGNEYEGDEYEDREGGAGSTDRVVFNEPSANHGADKNGVYYINLNDGLYVIKKDAKILTGLNDPDHPNRTDRYWNTTKKKAFVSLDDSHLDDLRKFNPSIDSSHFRAKRGSGDETRVLKLFSLDYLKYLNDRPRRGFKKKNRTSKAKTTSSGRGRPRKSASTFHGQMIDDSASDGSTDY